MSVEKSVESEIIEALRKLKLEVGNRLRYARNRYHGKIGVELTFQDGRVQFVRTFSDETFLAAIDSKSQA